MAESADGASPVMGAPAGLHSDDAAWVLGQKREDFIAREFLAERHPAVSTGAMRLKAPLCKVETDDANFFHGCPLHSWDAQTSPPWHIAMPSGGRIHSIKRIELWQALADRRSLRAHLRFADIVDIVDVVAEIGGPIAVRPASEIDPDHRHRLREVDVIARAFLDFSLQRRFVPATGRPTTRALQQPRRVIIDALHPDTTVAEEPVIGAEQPLRGRVVHVDGELVGHADAD